jgi:hypothetical protein
VGYVLKILKKQAKTPYQNTLYSGTMKKPPEGGSTCRVSPYSLAYTSCQAPKLALPSRATC